MSELSKEKREAADKLLESFTEEETKVFLQKLFDGDQYEKDCFQLGAILLESGKYFISSSLVTDDEGFNHFVARDHEGNEQNICFKISEL